MRTLAESVAVHAMFNEMCSDSPAGTSAERTADALLDIAETAISLCIADKEAAATGRSGQLLEPDAPSRLVKRCAERIGHCEKSTCSIAQQLLRLPCMMLLAGRRT